MSLLSRLQAAWQGLSTRDRRVLALALPLIAALVIYLVLVAPLQQRRAAAWAAVEQYKQDYYWLREQPPALGAACDQSGMAGASEAAPQELLRTRLTALGLSDARVSAAGDGQWDIAIAAAPGQPLLQFVDAMACAGFTPIAVSLQPVADAPGSVAAEISLLASNAGSGG